ncbi:electron transport complex protein RnfC [Klebsiella pneumoniae]|nr:electron transport complex protein RnfC [Klebsiella pneumoniae]
MFKLFSAFRKDKVWDFNGGIHPPEMKTQSNGTPLRQVSLPQRFVIPLKQHIGAEGELCVKVGDRVLRGQPLTRGWGRMLPVHAPTSGTIAAIAPHTTAHPSALAEMSVIIDADGEDRWIERDGWSDYQTRTREALIERIHQFGVAGLGGAGFPTGSKLRGGGDKIKTLIINAAECEPYITADDRLMQDCAAQIVEGIRILAHILQPEEVLIGIEDNKPQAISMLRAVLCDAHGISLRVIPTKYPSGGAKQLTQILTGKQVPHGGRSSDIGVLMQNVGTAYAVKRAVIDGEPLTERVVTLTGEAVTRPGNVWARLGTPVRHLLNDAGFCPSAEPMVIMGGPLMGFTLPWLDVPVVKITNCLLAPSASEMGEPQEEKGCIRCSACADACPADLLPQQLYWFSKGQQHDKATAHNLADCIECGACAWVCPSNIPLVQYFRQEKAEIAAIRQEEQRAAEAKARFEARQARLEREKAARAERHKKAAVQPAAKDQEAISAALARVRDKQRDAAQPIVIQAGAKPDNSEAIAAREARKAEARARKAQQQAAPMVAPAAEPVDPRKAAVEAAIARAKARKAEQQAAPVEAPAAEPVDPRKAAVEAAIARAKARKAEQQAAPVEARPSNRSTRARRRWKPLSPAPKRVKPNSRPRRWTPRPPNRSTRARRRWKPPSPAPKRVKPNSRPRRWTPRPPNRSTRARRRWKPPSPALKRVKPNSRPHNRISRQPQPMTTRAKRPSPRLSPAFRRVKQHSRQLTRNKWFSESQAPPIPITSGRPRVLCCWCCSPLCLALWSRPGFSAGAPYCRLSSPP